MHLTAIKDIKNLFTLKKENEAIKNRVIRDIINLFKHEEEEEHYYKLVGVDNFWHKNYIEHGSNSHRNKTLIEENYNEMRPYLNDIINDLKKSDTWKIQLTIAINFITFKDNGEEERLMHSKSDNIEFMIYDNADEVIQELFESLLNRYQIGVETSMKRSDFIFNCVYLLYCKCHEINPN